MDIEHEGDDEVDRASERPTGHAEAVGLEGDERLRNGLADTESVVDLKWWARHLVFGGVVVSVCGDADDGL